MATRDPLSISDRVFLIAFGCSVAFHMVLLVSRVLSLSWFTRMRDRLPIEVIYDVAAGQPEAQLLQVQLTRAKRDAAAAPAPTQIGERMQIRIPERPLLAAEQMLAEALPAREAIVDLTDLVNASRGDPVLLSYFSAIREQIQTTANRHSREMTEEAGGLVYTSFVLSADGAIADLAIVSDRSIRSRLLQDVSLRIVKAAAPFPPFPPSMKELRKTVVVPLEFLQGP